MAESLEKEGIEFEHVFDEGGSILVDGIKGLLEKPLGLVGTAEKVNNEMYLYQPYSCLWKSSVKHLLASACLDVWPKLVAMPM